MLLYDAPISPSPRRARMLLAEKGVEIETKQVDLRAGEQKTPKFLAMNPGATVPVLRTDTGVYLTENTAIASYIDDMFPDRPLMGETPEERALVLMWNSICETQGFTAAAETLRNSEAYPAGRAITGKTSFEAIPDLAERGRQRVDLFLELLEARLSQSPFLATDKFAFADITGYIVCEFLRLIKIPIPEENTATLAWYNAINKRPSASA